MIDNLGYCCINTTLRDQNPSIYSSRSITRKTFGSRDVGLRKVAELGLQNVKDILKILEWNLSNDISVFRIGSEPLPRSGDMTLQYGLNDLNNADEIKLVLDRVGRFSKLHNHSLSFHPGQYVCLGSPSEEVRQLGIYALERENEIADAIGNDLDIPINIHIGGSYGEDFEGTAKRFIDSYRSLSPSLQRRLCVENDDKGSCWSIRKLYDYIYSVAGIRICADLHHWLFCNETTDNNDDFRHADFLLAQSTWDGKSMQVHYSESPDDSKLVPKHSDYYRNPMPSWVSELNCHVHLECKSKELALLKYRKDFARKEAA